MLRTVGTFGVHTERHPVVYDLKDVLLYVKVLDDVPETVASPYHRKDLQETQAGGDGPVLEEIGAGPEHGRALPRAQHNHRVHQRIAVIGGHHHGAILRDVLQSLDLGLPIGKEGTKVPVKTHEPVSAAVAMDVGSARFGFRRHIV